MTRAAIVGLGLDGLVRSGGASSRVLAARAVRAAVEDAGLELRDLDGLIVCRSGAASEEDLGLDLCRVIGLRNLRLLQVVFAEGASAVSAIQTAALAIGTGMASTVACVFADAPLEPGRPARRSFGRVKVSRGIAGLRYTAGLFGGAAIYAMAARRYMETFGAKAESFGWVALAARRWAQLNPRAVFREPLTMEAYLSARWIVEPLRLYDCAVPVNGGIAVVITSAERAPDLKQPPVYILGMGQGHRGMPQRRGYEPGLASGGSLAKETAFAMAHISTADVDVVQFYDAFTYLTLLSLEEYGFCGKGEAKDFVLDGGIAPGGRLAVNTGGGHLSGYYLQGMTPVAEGVLQARGTAGARQCAKHDVVLVTNDGGCLEYHACLVLSPHKRVA